MKQMINTNQAPLAIGPYSQAIKMGNIVYFSGQLPLKWEADVEWRMIQSDDFTVHARQVFENLFTVTQAAGGNLHHIVKLTIYLVSMVDFNALNLVMQEYYPVTDQPYPARTVVAVRELPKQARLAIDAIMMLDD